MVKNLSPREIEVLKEIVKGSTNLAIAQKLFVSLATAQAHVSSISRKLNAINRVEAAVKGVELLKELEQEEKVEIL